MVVHLLGGVVTHMVLLIVVHAVRHHIVWLAGPEVTTVLLAIARREHVIFVVPRMLDCGRWA